MLRYAMPLLLLSIAFSVSAKEVLICETAPTRQEITPLTQETKFICPGVKDAKTLPELYRMGWRLIQYGGNNRVNMSNPALSEMTLVVALEKD
ncbi:hypothetical protein [Pseudoxanthomonas winnipegensis]|uniref:hypothetical protein n=1 Tax=Pseudoxanthomonas winnipegensis TaxID=2480810 RepID=UPI00103E9955|nr:hypothetical protein [Pseudoxanthomonas winnipegensis]TBV69788.1 hypothetical protein EYC45_19260 [Pseudoxanthomonas winnipegensis]